MNRNILNVAITFLFLFTILFIRASYSHAMGDFDEKAAPPPASPEQIKKEKEVKKTGFKEGMKRTVPNMRTYINLEKSSQFDSNFNTIAAMFASTELISLSNLKVIDAKTANEIYWYARYNIEALTLQSGMGVYLGYSRLMEKESLDKKVNNIIRKTGIASAPTGMYPIFLEFTSGSPFYAAEPNMSDFKTMRWNKPTFRQEILPESLGLSIAAKSKLAENLFSSHRGDLLGASPEDGFLGGMLTLSAISEVDALLNMLAYDGEKLGKVDNQTYNPDKGLKYFPRRINVKLEKGGEPQKPLEYSVADDGSSLFTHASLIFGVSEFYHYSNPLIKDNWDKIFGDEKSGALFSLEYHKAAKDLLQILFKNIVFIHFDRENNTFVSDYDKGKRGNNIFTDDFCMTMIGLSNLYKALPEDDKLKEDVKKYIITQANFAKDKLHNNSDGAFASGYDLLKNKAIPTRRFSLANQVSGMRGFIEAYKVTGDKMYFDLAKKTFDLIEKRLWAKEKGVYLSSEGGVVNVYTPYTTAVLFMDLVELAQEGLKEARDRITFAYRTMKALQLSEMSSTGEIFLKNEEIDKMIDTEGDRLFELSDDERTKGADAVLRKIADTDKDGVVKPSYAGGKFGGAPVFVNQATTPDIGEEKEGK